jgi:hypothetical protein
METYFQTGNQSAGPLARDFRLPSNAFADTTTVFGTESCAGCHFSAGACVDFKRDENGQLIYKDGNKVPIFGIDAAGRQTGNANFSWLLQMKAQSIEPPRPDKITLATRLLGPPFIIPVQIQSKHCRLAAKPNHPGERRDEFNTRRKRDRWFGYNAISDDAMRASDVEDGCSSGKTVGRRQRS